MKYFQHLLFVFLFMALFFLGPAGCGKEEKKGFHLVESKKVTRFCEGLTPLDQNLSTWMEMEPALLRSLEYVSRKPPGELALDRPELKLTWKDLQNTLQTLYDLLPVLDKDPGRLEKEFIWCALDKEPLLTGYYEPLIQGSLEPDPAYPYPVYGVPGDLQKTDLGAFHPRWEGQTLYYRVENGTVRPYFDRTAIEQNGTLQNRELEIAWVKDIVDLFFLQIQGSGRLLLPDGTTRYVLYGDKNGRQYVSLGTVLVERGLLPPDNVNMETIRKALKDNPELLDGLLATNPSYIFFSLDDNGPYGSMNKLLTPMVSLASDPGFFPLGSVVAMATEIPSEIPDTAESIQGIFLPQDTGGAIKKYRLDLFCGPGDRAAQIAGHLATRARVYLLLHKNTFK